MENVKIQQSEEKEFWFVDMGRKVIDGISMRMIKFKLTPETISRFGRMHNARNLHEPEVKELVNFMKDKKRFPLGMIFINRRSDGKYYIIDGNHRIEASRRILKDDPDFLFQDVPIAIVGNKLTDKQEKSIFFEINNGHKVSTMDKAKMLELYFPKTLVERSENGTIPFRITWASTSSRKSPSISVNVLADAVLSINKPYNLLYAPQKLKELEDLPTTYADLMTEFCVSYGKTFKEGDAIFYRNRAPVIMFRIWYLNVIKGSFTVSEIEKRWKNVINAPDVYESLTKLSGMGAKSPLQIPAEQAIISRMNSHYKDKVLAPYLVWGY